MKVDNINTQSGVGFKSKRTARKAAEQLAKNNPYSLTEPNQRYITNSIKELAKVPGEANVKFLLDTASRVKYSTNIKLKNTPKHNWKNLLLAAATTAALITPALLKDKFNKRISEIQTDKGLTDKEKEILKLRERLLNSVDIGQIQKETVGTIKDFKDNLDYFIVSSETTTEHKKYVLERLNYFMSDEYEINPQLKDKKSIAVAEMINDMAIHTPGHDVPNIKAVNQKQHGMCAAISIVRKKLAYEDKPNYVDAILSELDSSDSLMVYDRGKLFTKEKKPVQKVPVDFETALANGYRIIDASTMHWMQVAQMSGSSSVAFDEYKPFDSENFDVNKDAFYNIQFDNPELKKTQNYYQALKKAESVLSNYKAKVLKRDEIKTDKRQNLSRNLSSLAKTREALNRTIGELNPELSTSKIQEISSGILNLNRKFSDRIKPEDKFAYIPNEEESVKKEKIKGYILENTAIQDVPDDKLDKILDFTEYFISLKTNEQTKVSQIQEAQALYNAAAAFRYQMVKGLEESTMLSSFIQSEGLKDVESILRDKINEAGEKLKNNSEDSAEIIERVKNVFQLPKNSKADVLAVIKELDSHLNNILTQELDEIYEKLLVKGGRRGALVKQMEHIKNFAEYGDKDSIFALKKILNVKRHSDIPAAMEALQAKVIFGDDNTYLEIFNKFSNTSQLQNVINTFNVLISEMNGENGGELIEKFAEANNIKEDLSQDKLNQILNDLDVQINTTKLFIDDLVKTFTIKKNNGDVIISADPKDIIIKKWENEKLIIPAKNLKELQEHFNKISKDRSQDEFSTRQGKLHDKALYSFSKTEKATLKEIKNTINQMLSYVQKQIPVMHRELKEPLEELKRVIGIQNGNYWVREEGHSGLSSEEQVRILEHMTGRPHYETNDIKYAIEKIKTSPYSGISSSSVYHDSMGWHAQYIADIKPVNLKTGDSSFQEKDVLFHDNTWGASEHENNWVDSNGLLRTDYSDRRGGALGYITNSKFQNGNLTDRILNDMVLREKPDNTKSKIYKKLKHIDNDLYNSPQMTGIILDGYSPNARTIAAEIHDAMFIPSLSLISKFEKLAGKLSPEEIKHIIKLSDTAANGWKNTYDMLNKRLFSPFQPVIRTKEDYDKLPDDDYLKVVLEKTALKWNYPIQGLEPEVARVRNVKDLTKFRTAQKNRALNAFKYAFSKDINVTDYVCGEFGDDEYNKIDGILNKYNINLTENEYDSVGSKFEIDMDDFDGSAKNIIKKFCEIIKSDLDKVIHNEDAKKEILNVYKDFFKRAMYFNKDDIISSGVSNIVKFIDREFSPIDDNELVKIYRNIQNLTIEEFKKEILPKVKPEDLGIKNYTGYDILKKLLRYEDNAETAFMNTVYYDAFYPNYGQDDFEKAYRYKRFSREGMYHNKYNLASIYREMNSDLSYLTLPKLFNKYKGRNLTKYGAYPAYPKLEYLDEKALSYSYDSFIESLGYKQELIKGLQDQIESYHMAAKLSEFIKRTDKNEVISDSLFKDINIILGRLILNTDDNDTSMAELIDAAEKAMELPKGSLFKEYKPYIETVIAVIKSLENTTSEEALNKALKVEKDTLNETIKVFAKSLIQEKYRNDIISLAHKYIHALIKYNMEEEEKFRNELYESFSNYHILRNPEELLEAYMISVAKDSPDEKYKETYKTLLIRGLQYAQLANIQDILMGAVSKGVETSVKDMFKNYKYVSASGEETPMNSRTILAQMIHKLIIDEERDTALMFIDKLGLGEDYVKYISEAMDFDNLKKIMKEAYDMSNNYNSFIKKTEKILNETKSEVSDTEDYEQILDKSKNKLLKAAKTCNINKSEIVSIIKALDNIKNLYKENPSGSRTLLFDAALVDAKQQVTAEAAAKINNINLILTSNATMLDLVNQILLNEDSEENKSREEMNEKFKELLAYKDKLDSLQPKK